MLSRIILVAVIGALTLVGLTGCEMVSLPGPTPKVTQQPPPTFGPAGTPVPVPTSPPAVDPTMLTYYARGVKQVDHQFQRVDALCERGFQSLAAGAAARARHEFDACSGGLQQTMAAISNLSASVQLEDYQTNLTVALNNAALDAQQMSSSIRSNNKRAIRAAAQGYRASYGGFMDTLQEQAGVIFQCENALRAHGAVLHGSLSGCDQVPSAW